MTGGTRKKDIPIGKLLQAGIDLHQAGSLLQAKATYEEILRLDPRHFDALHLLGIIAAQMQDPAQAERLIARALEVNPTSQVAYANHGNTLLELGRPDEALISYEKAIAIAPNYAEAFNNRGLALQRLGNLHEALASFDKAIALQPQYAEAINNRGTALRLLGHLEDAVRSHDQALAIRPDYPEALNNRGVCLQDLGRLEAALTSYAAALSLSPDYAEALNNQGTCLQALGRSEEASKSYLRAIGLKPGYAQALNNLGIALQDLQRFEEALLRHDEAIALEPRFLEAHNSRGNALQGLMRLEEALKSFDQVIFAAPDYAPAHYNKGNALQKLKRPQDALESYDKALAIRPHYAEAWCNRGNALCFIGQLEQAEASYREAIRIDPDNLTIRSNWLFNINYFQSFSPADVLSEARNYGRKASGKIAARFKSWNLLLNQNKMKVGLVSGDLANHPVGYFLEGLIESIDLTRFELHAFVTSTLSDDLTKRIKPFFTKWTPIYDASDSAAATLIHQEGIHVLIDLSGHTAHNRLPIFSHKPAPVQASWLGYFSTTGLPEIDYFIGDPHMAPSSEEGNFVEKIWRLPETWFSLKPPDFALPVSQSPGLTNGYLTLGSFGNISKMNGRVISTWTSVLKRIPRSRLLLKANQFIDPQRVVEVREKFEGLGVSTDRLIIEGPESRETYFKAYQRVDFMLDTFPYPGGTTSVDALWMGVPVLTLKGDRFLSRLGESIAINAGLSEWIAKDVDDYVAKAAEFAADVERLAYLRTNLRARVLKSPLFDVGRFAENFSNALSGMFHERVKAITEGQ